VGALSFILPLRTVIPASVAHPIYDATMDNGDDISRDANGYAYDQGITSEIARHQDVLNQAWPEKDTTGYHAHNIHDQPADRHILVTVRLELKDDGEVFLPGRATRWNSRCVFVTSINDPRIARPGVWVLAADVRRRT
jgi:hypothetical protein